MEHLKFLRLQLALITEALTEVPDLPKAKRDKVKADLQNALAVIDQQTG